jgi:hypothetical protein
MIYEFRTYTIRAGTLPEFLKRFGDALPKRERFSKLAAFWHTDIGPLNQVIHVWPYENSNARTRIRAEAVKDRSWPPNTGEFILTMKAEILEPMPFSPKLDPSSSGPIFEMCINTFKPFTMPSIIKRWNEKLTERLRLSPLIGVFATDVGELNRWTHIWSYKTLDERAAVKAAAVASDLWPIRSDDIVIGEETKILLPAPFSPIQ